MAENLDVVAGLAAQQAPPLPAYELSQSDIIPTTFASQNALLRVPTYDTTWAQRFNTVDRPYHPTRLDDIPEAGPSNAPKPIPQPALFVGQLPLDRPQPRLSNASQPPPWRCETRPAPQPQAADWGPWNQPTLTRLESSGETRLSEPQTASPSASVATLRPAPPAPVSALSTQLRQTEMVPQPLQRSVSRHATSSPINITAPGFESSPPPYSAGSDVEWDMVSEISEDQVLCIPPDSPPPYSNESDSDGFTHVDFFN
jgi:hypothetical protein